jgi:hypothetical protein
MKKRHFRMRSLVLVLSASAFREPGVASEVTATKAKRADQFIDSVGINIHLNYSDTAYNEFENIVVPSLRYLGIRHVRTGIDDEREVVDRKRELANQGIGVLGIVPYRTPAISALLKQIEQQAEIFEAVEGPNETDEFQEFSYQGQGFPNGTIAFMRDFSKAMRMSKKAKHLPIVQTSLAFPESERDGDASGRTRTAILGDLSQYADIGNSHNYISWGDTPHEMATTRLPSSNRQHQESHTCRPRVDIKWVIPMDSKDSGTTAKVPHSIKRSKPAI